jgi:hypothetical protein
MKTKLIAIITAALISSNASSAVNIFTPTGGAFSGTQLETLYWDMTSNLASKSYDASYVGQFNLSNHGDFHHDLAAGSGMVISSEDLFADRSVGVRLNIGDVVGPSRTFSTIGFTGTTDFGGTMTSSPATTTYYGLKFKIGAATHYGWIKFTEDATQSLLKWAYESIPDTAIIISESTGPSSSDTQSSLNALSTSLRSSFNATVMSSNYANMNTYDCNLFDKNNMCISAGGRITTIDNPSSHHSAAVVVLGHKISPHIRIGGFLDQSVNHNMPSGVDMSNKNPMAGAFAVWNHQADGLGFQMKLANAYLDKDVTTSRAVVGTSEAGRGRTDLNTQSYVGELSYAFQYQEKTLVRPYFALRYTRIKQDGYTEDTTAAVTSPLTYAKLSDRSTSALMGVKVNHALTPKTNLTASLGVEQDLDHKSDQLIANGVSGLTSENFYNDIRHTRPVASLGAYYAVAKNQRLSGDIYYQQLPFQSTDSATAYVNYTIGF